jgi:hypothetical protein
MPPNRPRRSGVFRFPLRLQAGLGGEERLDALLLLEEEPALLRRQLLAIEIALHKPGAVH